jgi:YrbI family 3-deoxy-D-manno-octulosonate 8-phosphate phosphatase
MKIKLVITDIDGVWTDGGMYYDEKGNELKKYSTSDSAGVAFLKALKIPVAIITGEDTEIVKRRAEKLKIDYVFSGIRNKLEAVNELADKLGITMEEIAFIGNDINDIPLLRAVGLSAVPYDAKYYVRKHARWRLSNKGGNGAFREFVERILKKNNLLKKAIEIYLSEIK